MIRRTVKADVDVGAARLGRRRERLGWVDDVDLKGQTGS
jgi:hypothetical protein